MYPDHVVRLNLHRTVHEGGPLRFVLVHGSMDRQSGFARLVKHLREYGEVVTFDRRGYGRSRDVGGPFDIATHADDLAEVIGDRPSIVVGHSLGGVVALAAASRVGSVITGLVLYEIPMSWEPWWPKDSGGSIAASMTDQPSDAAEAFMRRVVGSERWDRLPERTRAKRRAEGVALVGEMTSIRAGCPWTPSEVRCPIVSGYGRGGRPQFARSAEEITNSFPDSVLVPMDAARHNAHSTEPELFARVLVGPLLERLRSGSFREPE